MQPHVLVTGAGSGIGLATVLELSRRGHRPLAAVHFDDQQELVGKMAADAGLTVDSVVLDVADPEASAAVVEAQRLRALVNCAGFVNAGAVLDVTDEEIRQHVEVMMIAPMRLARLALPSLRQHGAGRIINIGSVLGQMSTPLMGWYDASKHALEALDDALRIELAAEGIPVVLVEPGAIRTPIYAKAREEMADRESERYAAAYRRWSDLTRLLEPLFTPPEAVAATVVRALEAKRPHTRYYSGLGAPLAPWLYRLAPPVVRDAGLRLLLRL
jgi:NAD(P)-dependent dehydrogenase (short-subunit alcohol dehydrogenase family)